MLDLEEIIKNAGYSEDYFDSNTIDMLEWCVEVIELVKSGSFEYDTHKTDNVLSSLRNAVNEIDI